MIFIYYRIEKSTFGMKFLEFHSKLYYSILFMCFAYQIGQIQALIFLHEYITCHEWLCIGFITASAAGAALCGSRENNKILPVFADAIMDWGALLSITLLVRMPKMFGSRDSVVNSNIADLFKLCLRFQYFFKEIAAESEKRESVTNATFS